MNEEYRKRHSYHEIIKLGRERLEAYKPPQDKIQPQEIYKAPRHSVKGKRNP
jgi:hypothetical protein